MSALVRSRDLVHRGADRIRRLGQTVRVQDRPRRPFLHLSTKPDRSRVLPAKLVVVVGATLVGELGGTLFGSIPAWIAGSIVGFGAGLPTRSFGAGIVTSAVGGRARAIKARQSLY
jgi:hypothetical protein